MNDNKRCIINIVKEATTVFEVDLFIKKLVL